MISSDDPLDEIAEVNELEVPASIQPSGRKRNHRKPRVQADIFDPANKNANSGGKSPVSRIINSSQKAQKPIHQINKVVPPSTNAAIEVYGNGQDPMVALQRRMMEKRKQEAQRQYEPS